jgi:predicted ATPase
MNKMKEKIIIENFGGIKNIEFDFKPINILIGPQASGKSITVKLTYFFKNFFTEVFKSIENGETKIQLDKKQIEKFTNYFPKESWPKGAFKIEYQINNSFIRMTKKVNKPLHFDYSEDIVKIIQKGRFFFKDEQKKVELDPKISPYKIRRIASNRFNECLSKEISDVTIYSQYFIPAGRSFFANVQTSIFSFLSENRSLDPFLIEFGSFYESFKMFRNNDEDDKRVGKDFNEYVSEIMNGVYSREKNKDFLIHSDNRKVNLSNASSGQQETLPLVLVLKVLKSLKFTGGATLYIEEPEAHLFPIAQKRMVQLLARTFNTIDSNFQIIVTTHSPYILSSFNNLIEAGKIIKEKPKLEKQVYNVIPKEEAINPNDLIAYSLDKGEKKVLIDKNTKLISQNNLDSISDIIAIEFGKLLDIEYQ